MPYAALVLLRFGVAGPVLKLLAGLGGCLTGGVDVRRWSCMIGLTVVATLALAGCPLGPVIDGACPQVFASPLEAGIEPLAVEVVAGEVQFVFADAEARPGLAYEVWLHAVQAECVATGAPIGGRVAAGVSGEQRVSAACAELVARELLVASWSVRLVADGGGEVGHSRLEPITLGAMEAMRVACQGRP